MKSMELGLGAAVALAAGVASIFGLQLNITFQLEQRWTLLQSRLATIESVQRYNEQAISELKLQVEKLRERNRENERER